MKRQAISLLLCLLSLSPSQGKEKFRLLFNGKDLSGWEGEGYVLEKDHLVCTPQGKNLVTKASFASYILDFDFLLERGANHGIGLHYPGEGDAAYTGIELQILDHTAPEHESVEAKHHHGSIYSIAAAKKEGLKPAGQWNNQRVSVLGSQIKVVLNGVEILNENLDLLSAAHPEHQGLRRRAGQIALLGHGNTVKFKNINILEIPPTANAEGAIAAGFTPLFNGNDLTGWEAPTDEPKNWYVANRIIKHTGEEGVIKDLWTEASYKDFTLAFDWRWSSKGLPSQRPTVLPDGTYQLDASGQPVLHTIEEQDSGIFLRGASKSQVNLWNWNCGSGEIYGYRTDSSQSAEVLTACTPKRKADKSIGEWNRMLIKVKDQQVNVSLNGVSVIENAFLNGMPAEGPIGLQHHGQAVDFANLWIRKD